MTDVTLNPRHWRHWLAGGFGAGWSPLAPGTLGTLVAVPLWWWLATVLSFPLYLLLTLAFIGFGIPLCAAVARDLGVHDHGGIVWDEITGYFITMAGFSVHWQTALLGFVLFRLFDILKPWPISWLDRNLGGGLGIMLDDVLAGLFAWGCMLWLVGHFAPQWLPAFLL